VLQGGVSFLEGGVSCHGLSSVSCHVLHGGSSCHGLLMVSFHVLEDGVLSCAGVLSCVTSVYIGCLVMCFQM
jgi:hypothetical protein